MNRPAVAEPANTPLPLPTTLRPPTHGRTGLRPPPVLCGFSKRLRHTAILIGCLSLIALATSAQSQSSVTLAWDPDPGSAIAGYRLYDGTASRTYTNVIDVGNATTNTVSGLISGVTYFFAVTAYDTNGLESDYSAEVGYTVPLPTNSPPVIVLTSPANGTVYTEPATISLSASVTANGHSITQVQFNNGATLLGAVASAPYVFAWNNVSAGIYSLSAQVVYDPGSTVASAPVTVTVSSGRPGSGLTFAADSGTFTAPFVASNGTLSQSVTTGVTDGGEATYNFNIVNAGNYLVSAMVIAPSEAQNSFYVNIDSEPLDPLMIWDVPTSSTLTFQTVSWRGKGSGDPASSQFIPEVFTLSAGTHQLIIRGREANTTLGTISIAAVPPMLQIRATAGGPVILSGTGQPGQTYDVLSSQDYKSWTVIGTVTLDSTGYFDFTDPAGDSRPNCIYRLRGQ